MIQSDCGSEAVAIEFENNKISFTNEKKLDIIYRDKKLQELPYGVSVVGKVFYPERIHLPIHYKEGCYTFPYHE